MSEKEESGQQKPLDRPFVPSLPKNTSVGDGNIEEEKEEMKVLTGQGEVEDLQNDLFDLEECSSEKPEAEIPEDSKKAHEERKEEKRRNKPRRRFNTGWGQKPNYRRKKGVVYSDEILDEDST